MITLNHLVLVTALLKNIDNKNILVIFQLFTNFGTFKSNLAYVIHCNFVAVSQV